jgi:hypothetical protein
MKARGSDLRNIAYAIASGQLEADAWPVALQGADNDALVYVIGTLPDSGLLGAQREAARATLDVRLTAASVRALHRVECVGAVLAVVAIVVGLPGAIQSSIDLWAGLLR